LHSAPGAPLAAQAAWPTVFYFEGLNMRHTGWYGALTFAMAALALSASPALAAGEGGFDSAYVCKGCHEDHFRNWRTGLHAFTFNNPIFTAAYQKAYTETEGKAARICLPCHAPTAIVTGDYQAKLEITREGVTCDFCHTVTEVKMDIPAGFVNKTGPVKFSPGKERKPKDKEHAVAHSEDFASSKLCAGCHKLVNSHGLSVMDTYNEWNESAVKKEGKSCRTCHMKKIEGVKVPGAGFTEISDHSLSHTVATMKDAVTLQIKKPKKSSGPMAVEVVVTNAKAGHSIPTGTPERKLVVEVSTFDEKGALVEKQERVYRRVVADAAGTEIFSGGDVFLHGVKITQDNRLKSGESRTEKFTFEKRPASVKSVSAEAYFLYEPMTLQKAEMRIPFFDAFTQVE